jgi:uncharacterized protein YjbJ (UPF0337 family)
MGKPFLEKRACSHECAAGTPASHRHGARSRSGNRRSRTPVAADSGEQEHPMDNNRQNGAAHEVKGAVKEGVGKVTGDRSQELAGNIEKNAGKVQREVGKAADDVRDAAD